MDVSIIIVSYNTKDLLHDCIKSIYDHTSGISYEIIVSDNNSIDGSIELIHSFFPEVILIENHQNLGFGKANNRGLSIAKGKYILYLNSDTILLNNAIKYFFDYWEQNSLNIGALGCNLLDKDMYYNNQYSSSYPKLNLKKYIYDMLHVYYGINKEFFFHMLFNKPYSTIKEAKRYGYITGTIHHITGACLFLKNDIFAHFDEHYFMYEEETDLESRLITSKKSLLLIAGPSIIHLNGGSQKKSINLIDYYTSFSYTHKRLSQIYYYSKHGSSSFKILIYKLAILFLWSSPCLIVKNRKYFLDIILK